MNRAWCAAIFLLLGSSFFLSAGAAQSTLKEQALKAPPYDLARNYFDLKLLIERVIPIIERGLTVVTPDGKITKRKARKYKKEYDKQLSIYTKVITKRGYKTIAGSYQVRTSESCGRIQSNWVGSIHDDPARGIEIQQDGFEAQLFIRGEYEGEERTFENLAIVIKTFVLMRNAPNSEYYFWGEIKGENIVIRPDLSVLAGWPTWAGPPSEQDLRNCTITLEPRTGAGATQSTLTGRVMKMGEYGGAAQSTLKERALKAPAYDLARSYYNARTMIKHTIPAVERGSNIVIIGEGKITKRKARKYKKKYGKRLSIYAEAITERGYNTIAGSYRARTSESCGRIGSSWVGLIHEHPPSGVEIQQDGYEGQLNPWFEHEGKETMRNNLVMVIGGKELLRENLVIVVENIVMVHDDGNEDYFYRGEIKGQSIVIKPDLSVLAAWPKWAGPPRAQDLRNCTITLELRKGNPGD